MLEKSNLEQILISGLTIAGGSGAAVTGGVEGFVGDVEGSAGEVLSAGGFCVVELKFPFPQLKTNRIKAKSNVILFIFSSSPLLTPNKGKVVNLF
jgi:hypothetical protein